MAKMQKATLKKLQCPNCGAPLNQKNAKSQQIICPKCSAQVAIGSGAPKRIGTAEKMPPAPVPIKLGDTGTINDNAYTVLGRVSYRGWSQTDSSESWEWDEWLLGGEKGRLLWLSLDEKGFTLSRRKRFLAPFNPQRDSKLKVSPERSIRVHERYPARITGAEGELTWRAKRGDALFVAEGSGWGSRYSVSQTQNEIEFYEGTPLDAREVAQSFGNDEWLTEIKNRVQNKQVLQTAGIVCFLFAVLGLVAAVVTSFSGNSLPTQTLSLGDANPVGTITVPFDEAGRPAVITVDLRGTLPLNTYADFDISVTSPDGTESYLFVQEVWHESGYDEDGRWVESNYTTSEMFVPLQTGDHQLQFEYDSSAEVNSVNIAVTVTRNHIMPHWFAIYAVGAVIIGFIFIIMSGMSGQTNQPSTG